MPMMGTYDHELILIGWTEGMDEWGNIVPNETRTSVLCRLQSVGRQEFYAAAASGMQPELVFIVHAYEYNNERQVEYEGVKYDVIRTYRASYEEMELVCGRVIGSG